MKISRRFVLRGTGAAAMALPMLESLAPRGAKAGGNATPPYAIFLRQANGVGAAQSTEVGDEPERFWPRNPGALTQENIEGRALGELSDFADRMLVVGNVRMEFYDYGDGHARGVFQSLTGRPADVAGAGGSSEAGGESLDHRIGRELNPDGRESMFMYAGRNAGWLGGACLSHRGAASRRGPLHNPVLGYQQMMGIDSDQFATLIARQRSVNDLVKGEMDTLLGRPELSTQDRMRLELHQQSVRDLENGLQCNLDVEQEAVLHGLAAGYESTDGTQVLAAVRAHMDVAALAIACGYTRSVAIQVGNGNDGDTQYQNLDSGQLMENYHFVSHRRQSHGSDGAIIPNSDLLHHFVDVQFAQTFRHLLERLEAYVMPDGQALIDAGVSVWHNDSANGPGHGSLNVPYIVAGSAGGMLRNGEYIELPGGDTNHARVLNTLGSAAGLRAGDGSLISDHGDPGQNRNPLDEMMA
ncbi:MAG: DUF1552 domain-containing protein [Nannocystaceae bacterium]|nr:DUF1552 domain-containing protein [Nannocystaceae bacterium]